MESNRYFMAPTKTLRPPSLTYLMYSPLMQIRKKSGHKIDPCGAPKKTKKIKLENK